jgi:hypothetical protein
MLKYTTAREDVEDITNQILAIQAADELAKAEALAEESLDTPCNGRGAGKLFNYTLKDIADMIGVGDQANPAKRAGEVYTTGVRNFIKNQHIILHFEKAKILGLTDKDAEEYASLQYCLDLKSGNVKTTVERLLNG